MRNKKGFTLIELLAIIVILAVIMVIAVPQILNVVNGSKNGAWKNNVNMIERAITKNSKLVDPETGFYKYTIDGLCSNTSKFKEIVKADDTSITCSNNVFTLTGTGQFTGKSATITCTNNKCTVSINDGVLATGPGLYDSSNNLIASWDELINTYHMDPGWYFHYYDEENQIIDEFNDISYYWQEFIEEPSVSTDYPGITTPGWYKHSENGYIRITDFSAVNSNAPAIVFQKYDKLKNGTKLIIPGDIRVIKFFAFRNCINLETIVISEGIQAIADSSFASCINLNNLTLPNTLKFIDQGAFWYNRSLKTITVPGVYEIGEGAFGKCTNLGSVVLSEGILTIRNRVFEDDIKLKNITFPASLDSLELAFSVSSKGSFELADISQINITFADPYNWGVSVGPPPYHDEAIPDLTTQEAIQNALAGGRTIRKMNTNHTWEEFWEPIENLKNELDGLMYSPD